MMRRMSNRLAARSSREPPRSSSASCASSISSSPVRVSSFVATVRSFPDQMKNRLARTVRLSTAHASTFGERYQTRSASDRRSSFAALPYTSPSSSSTGLGSVTNVTPTDTAASRQKATIAPQNASARSDPNARTPALYSTYVPSAPTLPATMPQNPAHGVIRFQNIPMKNVANSGTLNTENSTWM